MNHDPIGDNSFRAAVPAMTRRAVTRGLLGGGVAAAFLAAGSQGVAMAQGTPVSTDAWPTRYVLSGGVLEIEFVPAVIGGEAQLDYRSADSTMTFAGDELTSEFSPALGRFVSVVIEQVDDGYERYLTLLVPEVNPDENGADVPISTLAIFTDHLTSIGGPGLVNGAIQRYEVVELEGVAQFSA